MSILIKKTSPLKNPAAIDWRPSEGFIYPSGMVQCPMKMSGMAILKCAELQKEFGCGSLKAFRLISKTKPGKIPFPWPWLRHRRECPERAPDQEVRELRLTLTPLKLVDKSRKNRRAYTCATCGGDKAFSARQCRACWLRASRKARYD